VTINLVALRTLRSDTPEKTTQIRRYILGLALLAATEDIELFLREGCLLRYQEERDVWREVPRRGEPREVGLPGRAEIRRWLLETGTRPFRDQWPQETSFDFDIKAAKELLGRHEEPDVEA
jgi:CRISPR-associated protein Csb1